MTTVDELMALARTAKDHLEARKSGDASRMNAWNDFCDTFTPDTVLSLLSALQEVVRPAPQAVDLLREVAINTPEGVARAAVHHCIATLLSAPQEVVQPARPNQGDFEDLLEKYWSLAYSEGQSGIGRGTEANEVLCKLRAMKSVQPVAQPTEARACEVFSMGEWCLWPTDRYEEAKQRGWQVRRLVVESAQPADESETAEHLCDCGAVYGTPHDCRYSHNRTMNFGGLEGGV